MKFSYVNISKEEGGITKLSWRRPAIKTIRVPRVQGAAL